MSTHDWVFPGSKPSSKGTTFGWARIFFAVPLVTRRPAREYSSPSVVRVTVKRVPGCFIRLMADDKHWLRSFLISINPLTRHVHFAPALSSILSNATLGTRISLPIRIVGMSPRLLRHRPHSG